MEHEAAVQTSAVERYVLGEMEPEERELFEEHFFECETCSLDVRAGSVFAANARALAREEARKRQAAPKRGWRGWLQPIWAPAFAMLLLAVVGYQSLVSIPRLNREVASATAPRQVGVTVLNGQARGTPAPVERNASEPLLLVFDLPPEPVFQKYDVEILTASGSRVAELPVTAPAQGGEVHILIPDEKMEPGKYTVVVRGHGSSSSPSANIEVSRYSFELKRK
jgi:anti-sigma factor RsiW